MTWFLGLSAVMATALIAAVLFLAACCWWVGCEARAAARFTRLWVDTYQTGLRQRQIEREVDET